MKIQSTRPPTARRPCTTGASEPSGLLFAVNRPSPRLQAAARRINGLPNLPNTVYVGVPANSFGKAEDNETAALFWKTVRAVTDVALAGAPPALRHSANLLWAGVGAVSLYNRWQRGDEPLAALMIDTAEWAFNSAALAQSMAGGGLLNRPAIQQSASTIFTLASSAAAGRDLRVTLNRHLWQGSLANSEIGPGFKLVQPLLNAALDGTGFPTASGAPRLIGLPGLSTTPDWFRATGAGAGAAQAVSTD